MGNQDGSVAKGLDRNLQVAGSSPHSGTLNFSVLVLPPVPRLGYQKDQGCGALVAEGLSVEL